jgi:predicted nucleic acid-binding protein
VTGVSARLGSRAGKEVFENLLYDPSIKVVFTNRSLAERSISTYLRYGKKLSFTDSVSLRIMFDRHIRTILSFDSDFDSVEGILRLR